MSFELLRDAVIAALDSTTFEKSKVAMAFERASADIAVITYTRKEVEEITNVISITDDEWIGVKDQIEDVIGGNDETIKEIVDQEVGRASSGDDDGDDDYDEITGTFWDDSDEPEHL